ncbi:MFS transporter [Patescibacteria group bacterium AH-259-L07]|nr:MFS transporter [Patescibacteria group bacterium AH-259-L07]
MQIGLTIGLSLLLGAFLVPLIGAIADATGRKIPILFISTIITVFLTALTGYVGLITALVLGSLANFFNIIDIDLYDAQLIDIADVKERGRISGFGIAVGYLGTISTLLMGYILMSQIGWGTKEAVQAIFPATAIFYFIFSLPLFFFLRDLPRPKIPFSQILKKALAELKHTLTRMPEMKGLGSFLLASFIYNNGMNTVIIFLSLYATQVIGLSIQSFFFVFAALALGAFFGSLIFGKISDKIGPKKSLTIALVIWILVVIYFLKVASIAAFLNTPFINTFLVQPTNDWFYQFLNIEKFVNPLVLAFILGGMAGGAVLGSVWVGNRHMITKLAPERKIAEIFGIEGLTGKFSGVIGPILFGLIVKLAGPGNEIVGYQNALWSILIFFILGLVILWQIPKEVEV